VNDEDSTKIGTVAVIGAGNAGKAAAADLTLRGGRVRLFEFPNTPKARTTSRAMPGFDAKDYAGPAGARTHGSGSRRRAGPRLKRFSTERPQISPDKTREVHAAGYRPNC